MRSPRWSDAQWICVIPGRLDAIEELTASGIRQEAERHGCSVEISRSFDMPPCVFSAKLQSAIEKAARECNVQSLPMLSGAFHDALFVNRVAPSAMMFVPCRDGLSHNEAEFVEPSHVVVGCEVLAQAVVKMI